MKRIAVLLIFQLIMLPCFALEFDLSVDEEIRKNYNPSKLEIEALPPIPIVEPTKEKPPITSIPSSPAIVPKGELSAPDRKPMISNIDKSTAIKVKKGTKFVLKSNQGLSDGSGVGTRISFVSQKPVTQRYITVPAGTTFYGEIVDSHLPQISGNGGLVEIIVDGFVYKGSTYGMKAKVTKVNDKKVFVNSIKGQRKYWKNMAKQVDKGQNFYRKTRRTSAKLSDNPFGTIIAPIPTVVGMGVYAVNFVGSPVISFFNRGGRIWIPAGSTFEIKLLEDAYIY